MENKTRTLIENLSLNDKAKLYYMALLKKGKIDKLPEDPKAAYVRDMMGKMEEGTDWYNIALDVAGLFPFVGEPADFANTVDYAIKGDYLMSALSAISMIPEVGDVVGKGGKLVVGTLKMSAKMTKKVIIVIRQNQGTIDKLFDTLERKSPDKFKPHIPKMKDALNKFATAGADVSDALSENQLKKTATELGYLNENDILQKIENGVNAISGGGRRHASVSDRGDKIRIKFSYMRDEFSDEEWGKIKTYITQMGLKILDDSNYYEANYDREEPAEAVPTIHLKK